MVGTIHKLPLPNEEFWADGVTGMARIFNCAPGVVKIIQGAEWPETGLPECFNVAEERLQRLANGPVESVF